MSHKGFVKVILVVVIIILAGLAGYFAFFRKSPAPIIQQPPIPTLISKPQNETAEWKIYRNEKFGFQLIYPPDVKISEQQGATSVHVMFKKQNLFELTFFAGMEERGGPEEGYSHIVWTKKINISGFETSEYLATSEVGGNNAFLSIMARQDGQTRFDQFWAFFDLRNKGEAVPQIEAIAKTLKYTQPQTLTTSEKQSIYNLFKSIVNWKTEDPTTNVQISHCIDSTAHDPNHKVYGMSFGPGSPDTVPSIQSIRSSVKTILTQNGWRKCTPDDNNQGDYYSNIGPWYQETYIKNGKLLQLNTNLSMGVGYSIVIQFEYSN